MAFENGRRTVALWWFEVKFGFGLLRCCGEEMSWPCGKHGELARGGCDFGLGPGVE
jgi:hypothetical protein